MWKLLWCTDARLCFSPFRAPVPRERAVAWTRCARCAAHALHMLLVSFTEHASDGGDKIGSECGHCVPSLGLFLFGLTQCRCSSSCCAELCRLLHSAGVSLLATACTECTLLLLLRPLACRCSTWARSAGQTTLRAYRMSWRERAAGRELGSSSWWAARTAGRKLSCKR